MKKVAVLGGGFAGLSAAHYIHEKGYEVTLFEKSDVLGGLAQGFTQPHWDWPLERAYHHLFKNDTDIQGFADEIGFDGIYFETPKTNSLYKEGDNYRIIPVDSPQDFLRFPLLSLVSRLRSAAVLAGLKVSPPLLLYEAQTVEEFARTYMGDEMWEVFFEELFRKKFGKYAGNILASFLWARINKRTRELGYIEGGFQAFIDYTEGFLKEKGISIKKGVEVKAVKKGKNEYTLNGETFDSIVSTLPTPIMAKLTQKIMPQSYNNKFKKLKYLHALVLIIESKEAILDETYWLNIMAKDIPIMFVGQHTNFVDKRHYGGNHVSYIGYYLDKDDPRMAMSDKELTDYVMPYLNKISGKKIETIKSHIFKAPFAQPIFDKDFLKNKPTFTTPLEDFYVANLDMTYPYDRGTNYAVKLGKDVSAYY